MLMTQIIPGLVVTDPMRQAAAAALDAHAPDVGPLTWARWTQPEGWTLVPDEDGTAYKAELTLWQSDARTVRVNLWYAPDRRGGAQPRPHSHPWAFRSHILAGHYVEDRYELAGGRVRTELGVEHRAGSVNEIPRELYHEVTEVEPGTLTLMLCGPGERGGWGYLDPETGQHTPTGPDPAFRARLAALNPHQQW
ncbi:hypothetical protein [Actinomadura sp. WAC 06369]|uniref:hypothetical protein n=1 Tax=Actinomadura sp. WAC 06369 TaxID=2203193 RepID=UPI000F776730|nr:hypothetical protein [Actinomadura sp. WAC 06369]RSN46560.1 hypothetical protein DMH08_35685 [Actinomadura sp. WAC 06369]